MSDYGIGLEEEAQSTAGSDPLAGADPRLVQAMLAFEVTCLLWAETMSSARLVDLLRAHHSLARAEGYVIPELLETVEVAP